MDSPTTPMELLAQLQQRRDELVQQKAQLLSAAAAQDARAADWQRKYDGTKPNKRDPNDLAMVADARNAAQRLRAQAADIDKQIEMVDAQIVKAQQDIEAYNAGLAKATSEGKVGEAAAVAAQANVEEARARATTQKVVLYVIGGCILIAAIVLAVRYLRKKKPAAA